MEHWIDITTMEYAGLYEIEINARADTVRHRKVLNGYRGKWVPDYPPKQEEEEITNNG